MTAEPVNLRAMNDAQLAAFSAYWLHQVERTPTTLTQHILREAAYSNLRDVRQEAKRRARMARQTGQRR